MEEAVKSYYASSDLFKDRMPLANYLKQMKGDLLFPSYSYDEVFGYEDPVADSPLFTPGDYSIASVGEEPVLLMEALENSNIDPKIVGFFKIVNNDPSLRGKFRITSVYREGAKTAQGRTSWHSKGLAADIVATSGNFDELERLMMLNTDLVAYCLKYGLGILDEYTKEGLKRPTGSTGPHMHIGPDRLAKMDFLKLLKKYGYA